jgi:hypothetical protein
MTEGTLLYCDPFVFKNGATPKPKYFIVLANTDKWKPADTELMPVLA